jgi:hypothetical protein
MNIKRARKNYKNDIDGRRGCAAEEDQRGLRKRIWI